MGCRVSCGLDPSSRKRPSRSHGRCGRCASKSSYSTRKYFKACRVATSSAYNSSTFTMVFVLPAEFRSTCRVSQYSYYGRSFIQTAAVVLGCHGENLLTGAYDENHTPDNRRCIRCEAMYIRVEKWCTDGDFNRMAWPQRVLDAFGQIVSTALKQSWLGALKDAHRPTSRILTSVLSASSSSWLSDVFSITFTAHFVPSDFRTASFTIAKDP